MERDYEQHELIDLGAASEQTLGATGDFPDLVGRIEQTGISDD